MIVRITKRVASMLLVLLFATSCSDRSRKAAATSSELEEALLLANAFLPTLNRNPEELKLIRVENRIYPGPGTV